MQVSRCNGHVMFHMPSLITLLTTPTMFVSLVRALSSQTYGTQLSFIQTLTYLAHMQSYCNFLVFSCLLSKLFRCKLESFKWNITRTTMSNVTSKTLCYFNFNISPLKLKSLKQQVFVNHATIKCQNAQKLNLTMAIYVCDGKNNVQGLT